jgi:hypothetical protein
MYLTIILLKMKKFFTSILILVLLAGSFTQCKKDKGDPPVLPPQESMVIDFANFITVAKGADVTEQKGINNTHWEFAATVAGFWRLVLAVNLAVPAATFKLSVDQDPVYLDNKTWQWVYNATIASISYKARLTGQIRTTDVLWKMYITKSGDNGFNDFLWYEGTSLLNGTQGQWILNESYEVPTALLQIDWTKSGNSLNTIKYTIIKNNEFKNSFIEYGTATGIYDSYYTINYFNGVNFSDIFVKWNRTTLNGTVQSTDYLDGQWYCWDTNKINLTTCP